VGCGGSGRSHGPRRATAAEKLALFEKLKARGGLDGENRVEPVKVERMVRTFAATEK